MIQWAKFASKAKKIGFKAKGAAIKLTGKMKPSPESILAARAKMQVGIRGAASKVRKLKKDPLAKGFGKGFKIGTFAVGGLAVGSGAYNLATGQRQVRVKKQTAKEINKMKKTYNI
jgi:hypothetical protein